MTLDEYINPISQVKGVKATKINLPPEAGKGVLPDDLILELSDNAKYLAEFGYDARDDPSVLHPKDVSLLPIDADIVADLYSSVLMSRLLLSRSGWRSKIGVRSSD